MPRERAGRYPRGWVPRVSLHHLEAVTNMSRGLGETQRAILEQLHGMNAGAGVLVGDNGGNTRRAAHALAARGLVTLEYLTVYGRVRLVARLVRRRSDTLRV